MIKMRNFLLYLMIIFGTISSVSAKGLFSNSYGSNLHIVFYNGFLNKEFHLCGNGRVLQENATNIDKVADLEKITDIKLKIALRIAYLIYKDCQKAMKQDK